MGPDEHPDEHRDGTAPARFELGNRRKVLLSLGALGAAAAVAVTGTFAAFTASVSRGHQVTTGTPTLVLGAAGAATNRLGIDIAGLSPGQSYYRSFDLQNTGTSTFSTLAVDTQVTSSSLLDTDATNGLQAMIESCSAPWVESGVSPAYTYTCPSGATRSTVLSSRPVKINAIAVPGLNALTAMGLDHLLLTESLPLSADNRFQNQMTALTYEFNAS